ncbi:VRR-NUC domain-containing protein [Janthinobacterium sp. GW460P]|uniref:VRR-NUC domain-containing protein n=1 Tax=unclassified Janthinobacterium TaxID=2610881 RepID=UPI000A326BE6|nr:MULTISPECIES: VRR-NUC domain-containing protein [unclassified Janthinobacterium]MCC7703777.1 VRR-NUC domain-containing protein [Janthinobacterium sp. GW460P]MCC7709263.1 VRR-NUC domain-containing protein [Janthinobacterium sp. GW460W]
MLRVLENPLYYLDNFQDVLHWISARYADLLSPEESRFITAFGALPQPSRALFVRLVMRKGCLFRASKLNYPEIGDTRAAALPLLATGWVEADPVIALDELFDLLLKVEIAQAFDLAPSLKAARKAEQLDALRELHAENKPFSAWHPACTDVLYRIGLQALCDRLRLIYFGNYHQDWSEFVLSDLGVYQYEKVEFSPASRGFRTRQDIEHYEVLQQCRERYNDSAPATEVLQQLAALSLSEDNTWLASRRDKLRFQIAQHLEKSQDWPAAYRAYADCRYPGARGRAIRVLEKDEQPQAAYERLMIALAAPESEAEQQLLLRMAPRLRRKLGHAKQAASAAASVERIDLHLPYPEQACYVEGVVQQHLMRDEAPVYYVENTLINSLFGLLCWPAIFKPMPGAFFHPFHRGPADLHSADFYQRRNPDFAACLAQLDDGSYHAAIRATLAAKRGIVSPFVSWDVLDGGLLDLALACIPAAHLKKAFERILLDIKSNRSGFPDLIQFWPAERRYRMIEVKGPGDRLQDNQLRWIAYCAEHAMPVSVCYLQWEGA